MRDEERRGGGFDEALEALLDDLRDEGRGDEDLLLARRAFEWGWMSRLFGAADEEGEA